MHQFLIAQRAELPRAILQALSVYRYEVFVRRLGWRLPDCDSGLEQDEFDTQHSVYIVASTSSGAICGCSRLLPTTQPYLLQEVFSRLVSSASLPRSRGVWELSRFAASTLVSERSKPNALLSRKLFEHACSAAAERGATELIGVLTLAGERVLRRFGADLKRLGPARAIEGRALVACKVNVLQPFSDGEIPPRSPTLLSNKHQYVLEAG